MLVQQADQQVGARAFRPDDDEAAERRLARPAGPSGEAAARLLQRVRSLGVHLRRGIVAILQPTPVVHGALDGLLRRPQRLGQPRGGHACHVRVAGGRQLGQHPSVHQVWEVSQDAVGRRGIVFFVLGRTGGKPEQDLWCRDLVQKRQELAQIILPRLLNKALDHFPPVVLFGPREHVLRPHWAIAKPGAPLQPATGGIVEQGVGGAPTGQDLDDHGLCPVQNIDMTRRVEMPRSGSAYAKIERLQA